MTIEFQQSMSKRQNVDFMILRYIDEIRRKIRKYDTMQNEKS